MAFILLQVSEDGRACIVPPLMSLCLSLRGLCFGFILLPNNKFLAWNLDKFSYAMHLKTQVKSISKAGQMFALSRI